MVQRALQHTPAAAAGASAAGSKKGGGFAALFGRHRNGSGKDDDGVKLGVGGNRFANIARMALAKKSGLGSGKHWLDDK